jgi:endonuclease/exonuclease/phosphatase family metal-dependent hydrolase
VHVTTPRNDDQAFLWEHDLGALPDAEPDGELQILAGDFNATLDHAKLRDVLDRGYRDAAEVAGAGLAPTRSTDSTVPLPATIDHVLVDERVGVRSVTTHDVPETDHRAVVADLGLPPSTG